MSSQKDPIQSLIVEIDGILQKANSRRPWPVSTDFAHACRVLERVRAYLVFQQQPSHSPQIEPKGQENTSQFARSVVKEIQSLRDNLTLPLQTELEALRRERESLVKEIRLLENRHQHYQSLAQQQAKQEQIISDFLQVLTGSLQESLTQQIGNTLLNLEISHSDELKDASIQHSTRAGHSDIVPTTQHPSYSRDRLEQLQQMQAEYDRMLINLDSTIRVVLEALQRNVVGYQESLSQGVANMHNLGQQGEVLFTALVNHLAQQLGREVSYMRTEQIQSSDSPTNSPPAKVRNVNNEPEAVRSKLNSKALSTQHSERESLQQEEVVQSSDRDPTVSQTAENQLELLPRLPATENTFPEEREVVEPNFDNLRLEPINADEIDALLQLDIAALVAESSSQQETDQEQEKPEVTTQEQEISNPAPVSVTSPDAKDAIAVNLDINNELDDLYSVLFGTALNNAVEPDEFELLIRGTPEVAFTPPTEVEPLVNLQQSVVDNTLNDREVITNEYLTESLFEDAIANSDFTSAPPISASQSISASWEDVLFNEDETDVASNQVVETDFAGSVNKENTSTISPDPEPEDIDTISALTDLFDEEELNTPADVANIISENSAIASEYTPDNILSVLESQDEPQQADPFLDGVEDRYIPAPIEENLLVTEESDSEPDIKLLLDRDLLQQLSEELSVFELLDDRDVRIEEKPPKLEVASTIQTDSLPTPELKPNTSNELLAEDWDGLTLNTSSPEDVNIAAPLETEENQDSKTNEATWSQDLLTLDALNWDLEKANSQEETAFSNWTLDNKNNNFVMSMDFSLEDTNAVAETVESAEQVQNLPPQTPPLTMGGDTSQNQNSNEWDWESESYQIDSLNWDMEEAIAKGEEGFGNWTLEEVANSDFGYSTIDFGLVDDVEEPKTSNSDNLNNSQSHPRLEKEGQDSNSDKI